MKRINKNGYTHTTNFLKKGNFVRGYSIVEIIVYLAVFTPLSILVINSFIVIMASFNTTNMNRKLLESGAISMDRISREVRQAKNVDIANSGVGVLQLNTTNSEGDSIYVKFKKEDDGSLNLYENSINGNNLLSQNVTVTSLIFRRITTTESEAVKIEMTLLYSKGSLNKSVNFYNTIVLRGGY